MQSGSFSILHSSFTISARRKNILVLRGGALGDFILTLPTLAALRQTWPTARLAFAGNATAARLAQARGLVDEVYSQHESRWAALFDVQPLPPGFAEWLGAFDTVISYWPDPDDTLAGRFPVRAGQQFVSAAAMPERAPAASHYLAALKPLGVAPPELWFRLKPLRDPGAAPAIRPVAVHPGSGSAKKNWPEERWLEVLAQLPPPVLMVAGEAEADRWTDARLLQTPLAARIRDGSLRVARGLSLEHLVDSISSCRLFLGHDSGVSHLAAACGVPCVLLFGPTDPTMWSPPAPHVAVLRRGHDLTSITTDDVLTALRRSAAL